MNKRLIFAALLLILFRELCVVNACWASPNVDDILNQLGGAGSGISLDTLTGRVIALALSVVRFLQTLALPGAAILLIVAAGMYGIASAGHNEALKRQAVSLAISTCVAFTLIKLAPLIVAVMYHGID